MKYTLLLIVILTLITYSEPLFTSAFKKLKQKAKNMYKKNFGKDKSWHYTGTDPSEYPGTNSEFRKIQADKWKNYYDCLAEQNKSLEGHMAAIPEAILGFAGTSTKLICKICLSPKEKEKSDSIEWEWASQDKKHLEPVDLTENILISPEDKSLFMYNLQVDQTGQYKCKLGESLTVPYFLTVVPTHDNKFIEVHTKKSNKTPHKQKPQEIPNHNMILDTEWGEWSGCSTCGEVGKKHKIGYCIVGMNSAESIDCPKAVLFEVKDKHGNVIEMANNSAGIYSMLQGTPPLEPEVQRRLQYGVKGKNVEINCPGNLNNDAPIQWQIGNLNVVPELVNKESNGRIIISITDRIHIKKAQIHDNNYYSCWQNQELAGVIQLVVEKKIELNFNHHIMLFGIIIILCTFIYVFIKVFLGRKYSKAGLGSDSTKKELDSKQFP